MDGLEKKQRLQTNCVMGDCTERNFRPFARRHLIYIIYNTLLYIYLVYITGYKYTKAKNGDTAEDARGE